MDGERKKILAVASSGGHWVQLLRLRPAFSGAEVVYVTTDSGYRDDVGGSRLHVVRNASRSNKIGLVILALEMLMVILRERPDVVVSTGAAPGFFAVRIARLIGARTLWIDSIANADRLSLSGRQLVGVADQVLTQWPHLQTPGGPTYAGAVL